MLISSSGIPQISPNSKTGKNLEDFRTEYESGNREINFIKEYIGFLEKNAREKPDNGLSSLFIKYKNPETKKLVLDYVSKCPVKQLSEQSIWELVGDYLLDDVYTNAFQYVHNNLTKFSWDKIDARYSILLKLDRKLSSEVNKIASPQKNSDNSYEFPEYEEDKFIWIESLLHKNVVPSATQLRAILKMYYMAKENDFQGMFFLLNLSFSLELFEDNNAYINATMGFIADHSIDKVLLKNCLSILNSIVEDGEAGSLEFNYFEVISKLYGKLGETVKAAEAQKKYDAIEAKRMERFGGLMKLLKKQQ